MSEQKLSREKIIRLFNKYEDVMFIDEVAIALRTTSKTIYTMVSDGTLQSFKSGRSLLVPKEWLVDYIMEFGYIKTDNPVDERIKKVLWFCSQNPKSNREIATHLGISAGYCKNVVVQGLINSGRLKTVNDSSHRGNICLYKAVSKMRLQDEI